MQTKKLNNTQNSILEPKTEQNEPYQNLWVISGASAEKADTTPYVVPILFWSCPYALGDNSINSFGEMQM